LKELAKKLGTASFSFAKQEDLQEILGVTIGSVTPFGLINDQRHEVNVVVERALFSYDLLNFHPLVNNATTAISSRDFMKFMDACGNSVQIVDFD
ncbi:MAG: YbaK/EbsC family protein, partial [bacterium]